jgi:hypothetical protein
MIQVSVGALKVAFQLLELAPVDAGTGILRVEHNCVIKVSDCALQTEFNLARWTEILGDPDLAELSDRIEIDRHGHILMTPPLGFRHSERQG